MLLVFENVNDIDFTSPYNSEGFPNRLKIPNFNANGVLVNYTITKREVVVNGITKVFKRVITPNDVKPFFELFLPEKNVLGITSVLLKNGTQYTNIPTNIIKTAKLNNNIDSKRTLILFYYNKLNIILF